MIGKYLDEKMTFENLLYLYFEEFEDLNNILLHFGFRIILRENQMFKLIVFNYSIFLFAQK